MKRLILFELIILFFATTFESDSPPGWYQQVLPVNKNITDIIFIDSLNGWVVTTWSPQFDTAYVSRTTNGGTNWSIEYKYPASFTSIFMTDINTGYITGGTGTGRLFKTTNGGLNWNLIYSAGQIFQDVFFINKDTGWVCDDDGTFGAGLLKTTNGGANWTQQLNNTFKPLKVFFINKDTGWVGTGDPNGRLFKTTDGGGSWNLQFTSIAPVESVFFLSSSKGWIRGGTSGSNGVAYTTNGGANWNNATGNTAAGFDLKFVNDSIGFSGMISFRIPKSTDGGKTWGYQTSPISNNLSTYMFRNDTLRGWAGGNGIVKTTDGGGPITGILQISTEIPSDYKLFQNYPNPFNPSTNIKYQIVNTKYVKLIVFDVQGKEVTTLVDQKQSAGTYEADWNASAYTSGVYFYSLIADGKTVETRKMVLLK